MIYLDAAATTLQKPPEVAQAAARTIRTCASPGRGGYGAAQKAAELAYETRELAARLFTCEPEQVVFTMNATHALNLAIFSLVPPGGRAVTSGFEHNAVLRPLHALGAQIVPADRQLFDPDAALSGFFRALERKPDAVICNAVSNVFGCRMPIEAIADLCRDQDVPLILDLSQAAGCMDIDQSSLRAAALAMPGHKGLYGPQGTGLLICGAPMTPLLYGGTGGASMLPTMPEELPERLEAGTQNVAGLGGLREGLRFVLEKTPQRIGAHEIALRERVAEALRGTPGLRCFVGEPGTQTGVLSLQFSDFSCESVAEALGRRGVAVRAGLHCAPMAHESANTLPGGTLRISFSAFNTAREADAFVNLLQNLLEKPSEAGILLAR